MVIYFISPPREFDFKENFEYIFENLIFFYKKEDVLDIYYNYLLVKNYLRYKNYIIWSGEMKGVETEIDTILYTLINIKKFDIKKEDIEESSGLFEMIEI